VPAALKVLSGFLRNRVLVLPEAGELLVGSSLEAHLCLPGEDVADRHAMIRRDAKANLHVVVPVSARLPTLLGGKRLTRPAPLRDGDRLEIGQHELEYVSAAERTPLDATPETHCASCGESLAPGLGEATLEGLSLGGEMICPRCVDQRLRTDRSLESYRVLRKIGQNEEEITYLAHDAEKDERVALRILKADRQADPCTTRRFLVRALVGLVLGHPNYLEVRRIGATRGILFAVLDHLDGAWKLETFVRQRSPQRSARAVWLCRQLAEVMRFARTRRIVVAKRKRSGVLVARRTLTVRVQAFDPTRELEASVMATEVFRETARRVGLDPQALVAAGFPEPRSEDEARLGRLAAEHAETYSIGRILWQLVTGRPFTPQAVPQVQAITIRRRAGTTGPTPLERLEFPCLNLLERVLVPKGSDRIKTLEQLVEAADAVSVAPEMADIESEDDVGDADLPDED
jgi:hypothetical protein